MELGTFPYLIHLPLNQTVRLHFYFPFPYSNPSLHNQSGAISSRGATGRYFHMNYVVFFFFSSFVSMCFYFPGEYIGLTPKLEAGNGLVRYAPLPRPL